MAKARDPNLRTLYSEWNQKLSDSGFKDIEEWRGGAWQLKKTGTMGRFERMSETEKVAKARYFEIIGEKIVETTFQDPADQKILTLYFEGKTRDEIQRELDPPLHRSTIYKKLYKWLRAWGLKR